MFKKNTKTFVAYSMVLLCTLLISGLSQVIADSDQTIAEWIGNDEDVCGYLFFNDFPKEFDVDQTYKLNITLTIEKLNCADAIEFGTIDWFIKINETFSTFVGYSAINENVSLGKQISFLSVWSIKEEINSAQGFVDASASFKLQNSTKLTTSYDFQLKIPIKIFFKVDTSLVIDSSKPKIKQGEAFLIQGSLISNNGPIPSINISNASEHSGKLIPEDGKIEIIYISPKREQINRTVYLDENGNFSDNFKPEIVGTWVANAKFVGYSHFSSSSSNPLLIEVEYRNPDYVFIAIFALIAIICGPIVLKLFYQKEVDISDLNEKEQNTELPWKKFKEWGLNFLNKKDESGPKQKNTNTESSDSSESKSENEKNQS